MAVEDGRIYRCFHGHFWFSLRSDLFDRFRGFFIVFLSTVSDKSVKCVPSSDMEWRHSYELWGKPNNLTETHFWSGLGPLPNELWRGSSWVWIQTGLSANQPQEMCVFLGFTSHHNAIVGHYSKIEPFLVANSTAAVCNRIVPEKELDQFPKHASFLNVCKHSSSTFCKK